MPHKLDLILPVMDEYVVSESVTSVPVVVTNKTKTSKSKIKYVSEPLIEDWVSDNEDENETETKSKQRKPSFAKIEVVKPSEQIKSPRESVKREKNNRQAKHPRKTLKVLEVNDKYKIGKRYHAVPPTYTRNFMPHKLDLILPDMDEYVVSESVTSVPVVVTNKAKTSK
nr:hypothetical protein [Tanacetum cinerariifolium]